MPYFLRTLKRTLIERTTVEARSTIGSDYLKDPKLCRIHGLYDDSGAYG